MRTGRSPVARATSCSTPAPMRTRARASRCVARLRVSGPYRIPHLAATSRAVYTNNVPAGAYRGFSTSQVLCASESAMDEIALLLGEDPVAFRMRHVIGEHDLYVGVDEPVDADLKESLTAAATSLGPAPIPSASQRRASAGTRSQGRRRRRRACRCDHPPPPRRVLGGRRRRRRARAGRARRARARSPREPSRCLSKRVQVRLGKHRPSALRPRNERQPHHHRHRARRRGCRRPAHGRARGGLGRFGSLRLPTSVSMASSSLVATSACRSGR